MIFKEYINEEKYLPGYDNKYLATKDGDIFSLKGKKKKMEGKITKKGYREITISHNGKNIHVLVHKIIAELFLGRRKKGFKIDHKDGNKLNNAFSNLEYVTNRENIERARDNGLLKNKLSKKDIIKIKEMSKKISMKEIAEKFGVTPSAISKILNNKRWKEK